VKTPRIISRSADSSMKLQARCNASAGFVVEPTEGGISFAEEG
jgi:hypothetical protein